MDRARIHSLARDNKKKNSSERALLLRGYDEGAARYGRFGQKSQKGRPARPARRARDH